MDPRLSSSATLTSPSPGGLFGDRLSAPLGLAPPPAGPARASDASPAACPAACAPASAAADPSLPRHARARAAFTRWAAPPERYADPDRRRLAHVVAASAALIGGASLIVAAAGGLAGDGRLVAIASGIAAVLALDVVLLRSGRQRAAAHLLLLAVLLGFSLAAWRHDARTSTLAWTALVPPVAAILVGGAWPFAYAAPAILAHAAVSARIGPDLTDEVLFGTVVAVAALLGRAYEASRLALVASIRRARDEASAANAEARAALANKSALLATVSHEIRTPLNGIIGLTDILLDHADLAPEPRGQAEAIQRAGRTLLRLVNDVLDLSKLAAGRLALDQADFDLAEVMGDVRSLFAAQARQKGLAFACAPKVDAPRALRGDAARLRQVLTNLVGNAFKFTDEGTVTAVASFAGRVNGRLVLRFEVEDTGIGISAVGQTRIFQPYMQASRSTAREYGGTGLGLTISSRLVNAMGGEIGVESVEGEGSRFWFTVPFEPAQQVPAPPAPARSLEGSRAAPAPSPSARSQRLPRLAASAAMAASAASVPPAPCAAASGARPRVLIVEDNPINQVVATKHCEKLGYAVRVAESGAVALGLLDGGERFDAILMDGQMPEMDGLEATARIRAREAERGRARTPIIALTASAMAGDRERFLAAGMDDFLTKPIQRGPLAEALARWAPAPASAGGASQPVGPQAGPEGAARDPEPRAALDRRAPSPRPASAGPAPAPVAAPALRSAVERLARSAASARVPPARRAPSARDRSDPGDPSEDVAALDDAVLEPLRSVGGEALVQELLRALLSDGARALELLRSADTKADVTSVRACAHRLGTTAARLGARPLMRACDDLEDAAGAGPDSGRATAARVAQVERALHQLARVLPPQTATEAPLDGASTDRMTAAA